MAASLGLRHPTAPLAAACVALALSACSSSATARTTPGVGSQPGTPSSTAAPSTLSTGSPPLTTPPTAGTSPAKPTGPATTVGTPREASTPSRRETPTPAVGPSQGAVAVPGDQVRVCTSTQLRLTLVAVVPQDGDSTGVINVRNAGRAACALNGYAHVTLLGVDRRPLMPQTQTRSTITPENLVTVQPVTGEVDVSMPGDGTVKVQATAKNPDSTACNEADYEVAARLLVTLPGGAEADISADPGQGRGKSLGSCSGRISVSAVGHAS